MRNIYTCVTNQQMHTEKKSSIIYCYLPQISVVSAASVRVTHKNKNDMQQLHKIHN
jgi:hypothetical protein